MNKKISYIDLERRILFDLVEKNREIVENKKTDSTTVYTKQQIWLKITNEYNRQPNVRKRLPKQLKRLWENTKARAKKNSTNNISSSTEDLLNMDQGSSLSDVSSFSQIYESQEKSDGNFDEILTPIVTARLKKVEDAADQQRELHNLLIQKEQLQIRTLQDQMKRQSELHSVNLEKQRELLDLRILHEKELHSQKIRNEQELHQLKLSEYNKIQTGSYPLLYK